jgi:hypothetical protein
MPVRRVIALVLLTLALAAVFNANSLVRGSETKPYGHNRDVWLSIWHPVQRVSDALYLDEPRALVDAISGHNGGGGGSFDFPSLADPALASGPDAEPTAAPIVAPSPTPIATVRPASSGAPLRLWVGGDSLAGIFGQSVVRDATDTGVIDAQLDYHLSTGLTRPDYFDWPAEFRGILRDQSPDVMVVIFGANDAQGIRTPAGETYQTGSDGWKREYARRVGAVMDMLRAPGRLIVWAGLPPMRDAAFSDRLQDLDHIYKLEAALHEGVVFVDTWSLFAGPDGRYAAYLPDAGGDMQLVREPDGVHLPRAGGDRLAGEVMRVIDQHVDLAPEATPVMPRGLQ